MTSVGTGRHYVIVGNGAAGVTAAETLRAGDASARITILTAEPSLMYSRPGLAYVATGEIPPRQVIARTRRWYEELGLELIFARAQKLDVVRQRIHLEDGNHLAYDRLLIATGARATPPPYGNHTLPGVVYLDTLEGTKELLRRARRRRRAVVIGGGITALEMSEAFASHRMETHLLVRRNRIWGRIFNEAEAKLLEEAMLEHGVKIHYNTEAAEILPRRWTQRVGALRLEGGGEIPCDVVGVAIGVRPQLELVRETPIEVDRGILVNSFMAASVPNVYAAGDCAQVYDPFADQHLLDILWPSAVAEGRVAALNMLGERQPYQKGAAFNVCKLFERHMAIIGQIDTGDEDETEEMQFLSRGSSEVWLRRPHYHVSAWSQNGPNSVRLTLSKDRIVGALVIGEQSLADPLRWFVEQRVDVSSIMRELAVGGDTTRRALLRAYYDRQYVESC